MACGLLAFGVVVVASSNTVAAPQAADSPLTQTDPSSGTEDAAEPSRGRPALVMASAQVQDASAGYSARIKDYWDRIYGEDRGGPERMEATPALPPSAPSAPEHDRLADFFDHLTVRYGFTYTRNIVKFTGDPTTALVVDDGPPLTVTPDGFSFPEAFEGSDDRLSSYLVLETRGYGHPRLNTYVSLIRQDDLDGTPAGSPFQSVLDAFDNNDRTEVINGYAELDGLGEGTLAPVSLRIGRQFVFDYSPELLGSPVIDGAMLRHHDAKLDVAVFSGRRVNFFGDPEDDFSMGGTAAYQFRSGTSGTVNYLFAPGLHRYAFDATHQIADVRAGAFLTFRNEHPIDLGVRGWYTDPTSAWSARAAAIRRLTDEDFSFDIFRSRNPRRNRLRLFRIRPATQLTLDVDHQLRSWLTLGAGVAARFVDGGEAPFDNSFEQVAVRVLWTPLERFDYLFRYRFRHIERESVSKVLRATLFDDIDRAGETEYHEISGDFHYRIRSGISARVGGYVGIFDSRNRLAEVTNVVVTGGYLQGRLRVLRLADLKLEYGIDRGNPEFQPDIAHQHTLRVGFDIAY